uniref:Uncharacterized protein n=1 Tax=Romanomermis culicivorax TaxID=13658 RepID=A0A915IVD6_ROMCU
MAVYTCLFRRNGTDRQHVETFSPKNFSIAKAVGILDRFFCGREFCGPQLRWQFQLSNEDE